MKNILLIAVAVFAGAAIGAFAQDVAPTPGPTPPSSMTPAPTPYGTPSSSVTPAPTPYGTPGRRSMRRTPGSLDPMRTPTPGGAAPDRTLGPRTSSIAVATITPTPGS